MRVIVDGSAIQTVHSSRPPSGVTRWVTGVIGSASSLNHGWSFEVLNASMTHLDLGPLRNGGGVRERWIPIPHRVYSRLRDRSLLPPLETLIGRFDVMLGTAFIPWPSLFAASVPVVYDLAFLRYPETVEPKTRDLLQRRVPKALRTASRVITISEAMRSEISDEFDIDPDLISVVYPGCRTAPGRPSAQNRGERPSFLAVGTLEPRKNLTALFRAQDLLEGQGLDAHLTIAGTMGWIDEVARRDLEERVKRGSVTLKGFVDDQALASLYADSVALVFPSHYEGFGIPVLEAMAHGCPVIASDIPVMREIGGAAALYVDQRDPGSIAAAMRRLLLDDGPADGMIRDGLELAKRFSWEASGAALSDACSIAASVRGSKRRASS